MKSTEGPAFSRRIERLSSSLIRELLALTQRPGVISFAGGLPACSLMPEIDSDSIPASFRQYGTTDGEPDLRETVAAMCREDGLDCEAGQVLITSGSQQGIDLVAKLFIDEGTVIFVEKPAYLAALQVFGLFGAKIVGIDIRADGLDLDSLRDKLQDTRPAFLYINPTYQNPTGACYSEAVRIELAALLDAHDIPLIEDNPYGALSYDGKAPAPVASYLKSALWTSLGTFSKIAIPAWRIGYMASHPGLAPYFTKLKQGTDLHTNRPGQWWCNRFLQDRQAYEQYLDELRDFYRTQRDAMESALQKYFSDFASWSMPHGGLFFWVSIHTDVDTASLLNEALENDVAFLPGSAFYPQDDAKRDSIRLSFSEVSIADINTGLEKLSRIFRRHAVAA
ncbi:MAG: PLP-dependent aminotransferase family protein [Gammaproteobacteria bacterium]|nr:PLP-dependent aminotransferase family protein [Gammaproteobacteria bacterium]